MINLIAIISAAGLAGWLYWAGGEGKPYNTKVRDFGVPIIMLALMATLNLWHWSLLPCAVLMFIGLTMYHKYLNPYFGKPKTDAYYFNWYAHGIGVALAFLPYAYFTSHWTGWIVYVIAMPILITITSELFDKVFYEAFARGALIMLGLVGFLI